VVVAMIGRGIRVTAKNAKDSLRISFRFLPFKDRDPGIAVKRLPRLKVLYHEMIASGGGFVNRHSLPIVYAMKNMECLQNM
jgi:hypothetical protein